MGERRIQVEFDKDTHLQKLELSKEQQTEIEKILPEKSPHDFIRFFVGDDRQYETLDYCVKELMNRCSPIELKCEDCGVISGNKNNPTYERYFLQMNITYYKAADMVAHVIHQNKLLHDKETLSKLAYHFLRCFRGIPNKGVLYFMLSEFLRRLLKEGLVTVVEYFKQFDNLTNLSTVNTALDRINMEILENKLRGVENQELNDLQKEFFTGKANYYTNELLIEKGRKTKQRTSKQGRPNRTDLAFYAHYLDTAKVDYFETYFPSLAAWKQLGIDFDKNAKNIQLKYNEIRSSNDRIQSKYVNTMEFVILSMLDDYPKAKELAKDELKLAKLK